MFALASALSLLLFAAVVSLWVRSHWRSDFRSKGGRTQVDRGVSTLEYVYVESSAGGIAVGKRSEIHNSFGMSGVMAWQYPSVSRFSTPARGYPSRQLFWSPSMPSRPPWWTHLGFHYHREVDLVFGVLKKNNWAVVVPYWSLAALTSVLPASWWLSSRRRRREAARVRGGLCAACGYDLRGSPDHCPECGVAGTRAPDHMPGQGDPG